MSAKKINVKEISIDGVRYELYLTEKTHLHVVDGNGKIGKGIYTVNFLPGEKPLTLANGETLTNVSGTCHGCCKGCERECYAKNYTVRHHNTVIKSAGENTLLVRYDLDRLFYEFERFVSCNMVAAIRLHSSGEFDSYEYFTRMIDFTAKHSEIRFYTYTKRFDYIERYVNDGGNIDNINGNKNYTINVSIWHDNYNNPYNLPAFVYDDGIDPDVAKLPHCPAVDCHGHNTGIQCTRCRSCLYAKPGTVKAVYAH